MAKPPDKPMAANRSKKNMRPNMRPTSLPSGLSSIIESSESDKPRVTRLMVNVLVSSTSAVVERGSLESFGLMDRVLCLLKYQAVLSHGTVPIESPMAFAIAPPVSESKLELKAQAQALRAAQALVAGCEKSKTKTETEIEIEIEKSWSRKFSRLPIKYSNIMFQPIINATNSPTATYEYIYAEPEV
uniref:Uncharacterized protein n=1 Tax=Glossina austeni TaxID=7395 RepID=A0A1A9USW1_GLOAU